MPGQSQPIPLPPSGRRARRRRRTLVAVLGAGLLAGGLAAPAGAAGAPEEGGGDPRTSVEPFGVLPDGTAVERWTLRNGDTTMRVLTFGGVIQTLEVPDADGDVDNVVLCYPDLEGY